MEKKELGIPETVIIHVGALNVRATGNVDFVKGELYVLVSPAKKNFRNADFL